MTTARRVTLLVIVLVLSAGLGAGYLIHALGRGSKGDQTTATSPASSTTLRAIVARPHVVFQSNIAGPSWGKVGVVPLSDPDGPRRLTTTSCDRVYSVGTGGLCLATDRGLVPRHRAVRLDSSLRPGTAVPIEGEPSRVRLSADGNLGSTTTFVTGHSYLSASFSTLTTIFDTRTMEKLHNLEEFAITLDGKPYRSVDVNVWGVTFQRNGNGFYATMSSKGKIHLVEGSLKDRTLRAIKQDVECPSLAPDGKRVAYKKRDNRSGSEGWRLHVLDLETGRAHALAVKDSVDDQVEWLDDEHVLYGMLRNGRFLESDIWVVPADGGGTPRVFIPDARSPAVVRSPVP